MKRKSISILLISIGICMLFSDFLALIIITIFGIYPSSNVEEIVLVLRVSIGLPLCIIGLILRYFIARESKSIRLNGKSIVLIITGLILLTIDLWIFYIISPLIEYGPYTSLIINGITFLLRVLAGLPVFIIGTHLAYRKDEF